MGLPGSGKTTLASELAPLINAKRINADEVRKIPHAALSLEDAEMLARMQRHMDTDTGCQSACPHAARQHHVLSANFALIRHYTDGSAIFNNYLVSAGVLKNPRATHPRTLGQGLGNTHGIGLPIRWDEDAAD